MWNNSNYGNDLNITKVDAESCSHPGPCDDDVKALLETPYIRRQMKKLDKEKLRIELDDYGCWDDEQLSNHEDNKMRWLWLSCGDITERRHMK